MQIEMNITSSLATAPPCCSAYRMIGTLIHLHKRICYSGGWIESFFAAAGLPSDGKNAPEFSQAAARVVGSKMTILDP